MIKLHYFTQTQAEDQPYAGFGISFQEDPHLYALEKNVPSTGFFFQDIQNLCAWCGGLTTAEMKAKVLDSEDYFFPEDGDTTFHAALPRPIHDIVCVGLNYQDHIEECNRGLDFQAPEVPTYFSKRATKLMTHGEALPSFQLIDTQIDYEVELAVVIGKGGINIPKTEVKNHILGYAVFNDFSARTVQKETGQWSRGKGLDGLSAMGTEIVLAKDLSYPPKFHIKSYVNGELRQDSTTDAVRFDLDTIISRFSEGTTLEAGDIIITGTPAGVAMGMKPPVYLKKGDLVRCEIEGIGVLENSIS